MDVTSTACRCCCGKGRLLQQWSNSYKVYRQVHYDSRIVKNVAWLNLCVLLSAVTLRCSRVRYYTRWASADHQCVTQHRVACIGLQKASVDVRCVLMCASLCEDSRCGDVGWPVSSTMTACATQLTGSPACQRWIAVALRLCRWSAHAYRPDIDQ
jgi:hypothetical protein